MTNVLEKKIYQLIGGDKTVESSGMEENYKRPIRKEYNSSFDCKCLVRKY